MFFICCLTIGYWTQKSSMMQTNLISSINEHYRSRATFLNKTFCGQFVSGKWQTTINASEIIERNDFLQRRMKSLELVHENQSCVEFITTNGFYAKNITHIEYRNPMAFSILIYKNLYQVQVLMRTLYSRSNFHCIHVDGKASSHLYRYAVKLSTCLDNVYLAPSRVNVSWGTMSVLEVERICQIDLLRRSSKWYYHMTIAGTELPIQTNLNRIQILQLVPDKSRNDVSSFSQPHNRQTSKNSSPPGNLTVYKGEFHSILTRDFIQAVHHNPLALEFWSYLNGTYVPDEHFYPTLVHLPQLPGGKARGELTYVYYDLLSHYKSWSDQIHNACQSDQFIDDVCQFNYKDLANIEQSRRLFANKFNQYFDLIGIDCWENWLYIKQRHHQNIYPDDFVDKMPFTRKTINSSLP